MAAGWTLDTLEAFLSDKIEHLKEMSDQRELRNRERIENLKENVQMALTASDKAISKAEQATDKRFEATNEFRQTLSDQSATLLPRTEYAVQNASLVEKYESLNQRVTILDSSLSG